MRGKNQLLRWGGEPLARCGCEVERQKITFQLGATTYSVRGRRINYLALLMEIYGVVLLLEGEG